MAISAKFQADFSSFQQAVDKAEVSLKSFETGAAKVEKQLSRMADSFSGRRIVQDAELATKAVAEIGGATKLTENEQAKLNAQLNEALAKYKALGLTAPKGMVDLEAKTRGVSKQLTLLDRAASSVVGTVGKIASGFAIGNLISSGVSALQRWTSEAIEAAGATVDLSKKTGLSTDSIQRMAFVAKQTGTTVDSFTTAAFQLGIRLSGGEKSVVAGVGALGLEFEKLKGLSPDGQFDAVTRALENMENPQERNRLAVELFGKAAKDILPAIAQGYSNIADAASISSQQQLEAIDRASDAWDAFIEKQKNGITQFLGSLVAANSGVTKLTEAQRLEYTRIAAAGGDAFAFLDKALKENAKLHGDVNLKTEETTFTVNVLGETAETAAKRLREHNANLMLMSRILKEAAKEEHDTEVALRKSQLALEDYVKAHRKLLELLPQTIPLYVSWNERIQLNADRLKLSAKIMGSEWNTEAERMHKAIKYAEKAFEQADHELRNFIGSLQTLANVVGTGNVLGRMVNDIANIADAWLKAADAGKAYANATTVAGKAGAVIGGASAVWQATSSKNRGASVAGGALAGASFGANPALAAATGGWSIAIGAAAGAITGWVRTMGQGRKAVKEFVDQAYGSFDALHEKLNELPDDGERLWKALTQGVGNGDVKGAEGAINDIITALDKQAKKEAETAQAAVDAAQAEADAHQKVLDSLNATLEGLDQQYKQLYDTVKDEAPEEEMGVLERQARAQMAVIEEQQKAVKKQIEEAMKSAEKGLTDTVDTAQKVADELERIFREVDIPPIHVPIDMTNGNSVTNPPILEGGMAAGGQPMNITVVSELDGYEVARNQVRYIPSVLEANGV